MVEHHHHTRTVASAEDYPLERLEDPCNDRKMRDVPRPPRYPMTVANLYETRDGTSSILHAFPYFSDNITFISLEMLNRLKGVWAASATGEALALTSC